MGLDDTRRAPAGNAYGQGYYNELSLAMKISFSAPINSLPLPIPSICMKYKRRYGQNSLYMVQILVLTVMEITGIFVVFAFIHSLCVQDSIKGFVRKSFGEAFVKSFYRLSYSFFSAITTGAAFGLIHSLGDHVLFKGPALFRWLMHLVQLSGLLLAMSTFRVLDFREFLGIRQAWLYVKGEAPSGDSEGLTVNRLITRGAYGLVRHPLYLAGIVIFTFEPDITRNWLTIAILADAYFVYGAVAEEKRLKEKFGDEYVHYTHSVPMFMPGLKPLRKKSRISFH